MKYGYFDDCNKEYVITTPKTPLPWINYLGNRDFFSLISNTCGGYSFYKDAKLLRITRYRYNDVPSDMSGRFYYICDGDNAAFSPAFLPSKTNLTTFSCRHGLGYSVFQSEKNGLSTDLKCFVPLNDNCEVNLLSVTNHSAYEKTISLYGAVEFCLWNAVDDSTNFQRNLNIGEVEVENSVIYHKTEYRERRNHYAFYSVNVPTCGFDTDRATFLGQFNGWDSPQAVSKRCSYNSIASGWSPIGCHHIDFHLRAGETRQFVFILGYAQNKEEEKFLSTDVINKTVAQSIIAKYDTADKALSALQEIKDYWSKLLGKINVNTPSTQFNRSVNIWNQYQCMVTFNMSRSASYYESGTGRGMGFRDSCQDLLGFVHLIPERSRERIIDIASIQFEDGSTYHQYQPLTKRGNADIGGGFNDDPLWLIACVVAYIKETGDSTILSHPTPFNNVEGSQKPLFEHLRRSINYTISHKGPHGLPLIGRADWNDCLNLNCFSTQPGESFQTCGNVESQAESVFIAGMFVKYGKEYSQLCYRFGDKSEGDAIAKEVTQMEQSVLQYGWDGEWFVRAYDAFQHKVGSKENNEGKIFIEPQGFCVMAGIGGKEYADKALKSVERYLVNDFGIEILTPPYSVYHPELGEVSSYPRGYKENGSVFTHNNPWIVLAHTAIGNGNDAFRLFALTCPAFNEDRSDIRKTEPYVYAQTTAGRASVNYGLAKNSWLTGTASWSMVASVQGILGIKPDYDGLILSPCLPETFDGYTAARMFRGTQYSIKVVRDGNKRLVVNGKQIEGNLIPLQTADSIVELHI